MKAIIGVYSAGNNFALQAAKRYLESLEQGERDRIMNTENIKSVAERLEQPKNCGINGHIIAEDELPAITPAKERTLRPCPNPKCGADAAYIHTAPGPNPKRYTVKCRVCKTSLKYRFDSPATATLYWNKIPRNGKEGSDQE